MNKNFCLSNFIKHIKIMCLIIFICVSTANAQIVSTFLTGSGLNGPDGFALDSAQNLYCANWGGGVGSTILKITPLAEVTVYNSAMNAPDGLAFDSSGNLYVSNYTTGDINKITQGGATTIFASGFNNPSDLAFDSAWNLHVSNFGGTTVSKITPEGIVSIYASGFNGPLGLVFDPEGNLYVSNYNSGVINKISPNGTVTVFATVPNPTSSRIQYLARGSSGNLYLPSYGHHKIYKISPTGEVSVFAGTGVAGSTNGDVTIAQFNGPNSIVMNSDGDLYVSEYNANRIRKITGVEPPTSVEGREEEIPQKFFLMQNYPNPFNPSTKIKYSIPEMSNVSIKVYNITGEEIVTLLNEETEKGLYEVTFNQPGLASGLYIFRMIAGNFTSTKKMLMMK